MSPLPHRIERTRNRHSRAVLDGDVIVIRLARGLTGSQERQHVEHLLRRMASVVAKEQRRTAIDPFRPLLQGEPSCRVEIAEGGSYLFQLKPGSQNRSVQTEEGWQVTVAPDVQRKELHRLLWKLLARSEEPILDARIRELNARTLKVPIQGTRLKFAASQWGSCSAGDVITLNPALLFTEEELLNYVVIHELAHCLHKNHSRRFWAAVARGMPEHRAARKRLRMFRIPPL